VGFGHRNTHNYSTDNYSANATSRDLKFA
jgi:hypothetical protein